MLTTESIDVHHLLREDPALESGQVSALEQALTGPQLTEIRREAGNMQAEAMDIQDPSSTLLIRAGIAMYVLGNHRSAVNLLSRASGNGAACYYAAHAYTALEEHVEAEQKYAEAAELSYDPIEGTLRRSGSIRAQGRLDEAESVLRGVATEAAGRAEYSFQMGCILADRGDIYGAIEYFERAVDMDPHHARALFRLAAENSNRGNDEEAIRLYEQCLSKPPHYLGALMNVGLLYEDRENYKAAAYCFRRILDLDPNHERAELYLKDIDATSDMYYDEDSARNEARIEQLLSRPVTDFELSVRSRNCLGAMDIFTLGDLTSISEHDLLGGKNFGETSLDEIRDMMVAHGLMIGQNLHAGKASEQVNVQQMNLTPEEQAQLSRPISDLNLSVRARKCMSRLALSTLGELVHRTADELLSSRNFGVTSLNEIRGRLSEIDLKLRND